MQNFAQTPSRTPVREPTIVRWLFGSPQSAPIWLVIRIWVGLQWFFAGWGKANFFHDPHGGGWFDKGGAGLKGFWGSALGLTTGAKGPATTYDWYQSVIKFLYDRGDYSWFAWIIPLGEMAVGLGLIFGLFTGIAAFFGGLMNFSFELAGTTSTNPVLFLFAVLLIMGWRVAGWWGLDRYALKWVGTPWQRGKVFRHSTSAIPAVAAPVPVA